MTLFVDWGQIKFFFRLFFGSYLWGTPPNVKILAFLASFRATLTVFWADFASLGPFGAFWALFGPFGPFWSVFDPFSLVASSPWWQALEFEAI